MSVLDILNKAGKIASAVLKTIIVLLFMAMVVLVFAQVFTRFLTDSALTWSEELSRFIMIWMVFLACITTFSSNDHIMVDVLVTQLKGKPRTLLLMLSKLMVLVYSAFTVIGASQFLPTVSMQKSPANGITMSHVYIVIPISLACIGILCIKDLYVLGKELFSDIGKDNGEVGK